jgi:hypothetical protein
VKVGKKGRGRRIAGGDDLGGFERRRRKERGKDLHRR